MILICYEGVVRMRPSEISISFWGNVAYLMNLWGKIERSGLYIDMFWILRKRFYVGLKLVLNRRRGRTVMLKISIIFL